MAKKKHKTADDLYLEYKETVMKVNYPYEYALLSNDYKENAKYRKDIPSNSDCTVTHRVLHPLARRLVDYSGTVIMFPSGSPNDS